MTATSNQTPQDSRPGPHRRLGAAVGGASARIRRRKANPAGRVWTSKLLWIALAGIVLALAVAPFDGDITRYVRSHGRVGLIGLMARLTDVGLAQWYIAAGALVFLAVAMIDWSGHGMRGRARLLFLLGQGGYVFAVSVLAELVTDVVKIPIGRARPIGFDQFGPYHFEPFSVSHAFASLPSGHSAMMGAVAAILAIWFPRFKWVFLALGFLAAATRVASGSHYPSDVVAGFTVGVLLAIVVARWLASRGVVFRLLEGRLFPRVRNATALRSPPRKSQSI